MTVTGKEAADKVSRVGLRSANWNGSTLSLVCQDNTRIKVESKIQREGDNYKPSLVFTEEPIPNIVPEDY